MGNVLIYFRLFRWPNLLVLVLTQYLFRYAVLLPAVEARGLQPGMPHWLFALLVASTAGIAAAGYAINDYFDLGIDRINKPGRIILGRILGRRHAIFAHQLLNLVSVSLGLFASIRLDSWLMALVFLGSPAILWLYSVRLKRGFLGGNLVVALLTAFPVGLVWLAEYRGLVQTGAWVQAGWAEMNQLVWFYGLLAFLLTVAREILKDMEDMQGDGCMGCRTVPLVMGQKKAKLIVIFLLLLLVMCIAFSQAILFRPGNPGMSLYLAIMVQLPSLAIIPALWREERKEGYGRLQRLTKLILAAGVVSMLVYQPDLPGS